MCRRVACASDLAQVNTGTSRGTISKNSSTDRFIFRTVTPRRRCFGGEKCTRTIPGRHYSAHYTVVVVVGECVTVAVGVAPAIDRIQNLRPSAVNFNGPRRDKPTRVLDIDVGTKCTTNNMRRYCRIGIVL